MLLLDEPVAGVPEAERRDILDTIAALPEDVAILLIEHDMDLVFRFATRVSVLVAGALFAEGEPSEIARDARVKAISRRDRRTGRAMTGGARVLLVVDGLSVGHGEAIILSNVSFELREGESLALLGRNGTGKTTLIESIVGLTRRHAGTMRLHGRGMAGLAPYQRAALGIGWVPQVRNIFKCLTVEENLTAIERAPCAALTASTHGASRASMRCFRA